MTETPDLPKPTLILIALVQGLLLLLLYKSVQGDGWLAHAAAWQYAAFTAAVVGPSFLLLSLDRDNTRRLLLWVAPFTALAAALGYYTGTQQLPGDSGEAVVYGLTMTIACFKALLYIQQYATGAPVTYPRLYQFSWRNFLTQGSALAFTGLFWGILMLWAALFKVIKINFFFDLFTDQWFLYPALGMAHGFGIIIFRSQQKIFDLAARINEALMKFLLVMLVLLAIVFLCALPFTGLAPLWETGTGSALILWLQALVLFFLNGVYQDGEVRPYPLAVHRFIYIGVALLPVYSVIAIYGLHLRVEQYGWTLERCWAAVICALLALFSVGYLVGICRLRDRWVADLAWVNVRMGLLVLGLLLLTNSPLLDFRRIVATNQMARLDSGAVTLRQFDYVYFRRHLARPGREALQALRERVATSDRMVAEKIDKLYERDGGYSERNFDAESDIAAPTIWPRGATIPPAIMEDITRWLGQHVAVRKDLQSYVFAVDLNGDHVDEYLVARGSGKARMAMLFISTPSGWRQLNVAVNGAASDAELAASIEQGSVQVVAPELDDLQVGGLRFEVYP